MPTQKQIPRKYMKLKHVFSCGIYSSALLLATGAQAQEEESSPFAFSVSLDYNSHFMSYGFNVWADETQDIGDAFLFEPSASVSYDISETQGLYTGVWFDINSLGDDPDVGPDLGDSVQEMDLWIGYWVSLSDFTFDFTLQSWQYLGEVEGIFDLTVSYDTLLAPYIKAHNRFDDVGGQEHGTIFEVGATLYEGECEGLSYSFPVGIGFSFDDYHVAGEQGYAYSFIGASASYVIYRCDGADVDIHGGLTYYDTKKATTGNPESGYLTANFGVGLSF